MKAIKQTSYQCDICGSVYGTKDQALSCESRLAKHTGVKVGDVVRVLSGDAAGQLARVVKTGIHSKDWGHYAADRYWHTEFVVADILEGCGSRHLTFDAYEIVQGGRREGDL